MYSKAQTHSQDLTPTRGHLIRIALASDGERTIQDIGMSCQCPQLDWNVLLRMTGVTQQLNYNPEKQQHLLLQSLPSLNIR